MPYTVKHDSASDIVEVTLTGALAGEDLTAVTHEAIDLQKRTGSTRFLLNVKEWLASALGTIYKMATSQYFKERLQRNSRIAVILPASVSAQQAAQFYETVCHNYGWNAKVCTNREEAIEWLTAGRPVPGTRPTGRA